MGKRARIRQEHLPKKLFKIRQKLGISQTEMLKCLGFEEQLNYKRISEYELGKNEPPLAVLLSYARLAEVSMETLVDDNLKLPENFS